MAKDPAFLFYSKDWIEGTAEMLPEEKGVYIDLLAHQHQSGSLPADTRRLAAIARLSHDEFIRIWGNGLSLKFTATDAPNGKRLVNRRLSDVVTERQDNAKINQVISIYGVLLKKLKILPEQKEILRKHLNVNDFVKLEKKEITERLTEWITVRLYNRLPSLVNGNANGNANINTEDRGMGKGEPASSNQQPDISHETYNPEAYMLALDELAIKVGMDVEYIFSITQQCMGLTDADVKNWMQAFNSFLKFRHGPDIRKTEADYRMHFPNWLLGRNLSTENPLTYSPVKKQHGSKHNTAVSTAHKLGNKSGGFHYLSEAVNQSAGG